MLYERGTRIPILEISRTEQEHRIISLVEDWFETKGKEAQYVQVAVRLTIPSLNNHFPCAFMKTVAYPHLLLVTNRLLLPSPRSSVLFHGRILRVGIGPRLHAGTSALSSRWWQWC
jgi:hypothetical protein